jgi:5-dehydro-2-deoxygluconokinase
MAEISRLRARLRGKRFLVLGRAGMDLYPDPPGTRIEDAVRMVACLGGSSGNIAAALARQGARVSMLTKLSDDAIGRFTRAELAKYGIDDAYVSVAGGGARTTLAFAETRVEDHQSVLYRNGAADFSLSVDDVAAVDFGAFDALIATGTALAMEPSRGAVLAAFDLARAAGVPVVLDIDYRPYSWPSAEVAAATYARAAGLCDVVIGNDVEFGVLAGSVGEGLARARELAAGSVQIVVYKRGEDGAVTFADGVEYRTGIYPVTALKPTGAGDAFMGSFICALADDVDVRGAVLRGSAAAAIVVGRVGCAPAMPTPSELNEFLAGHVGPTDPLKD